MDNKLKKITNSIIENKSQALSGEVSSKLNQLRQRALQGSVKKNYSRFSWLLPVAAVLVMVLMLAPFRQNDYATEPEAVVDLVLLEDMDVLDQFELIENLEFYQWLSLEEESNS
jgi:hypothetical protein